jgi:hypothetical protein
MSIILLLLLAVIILPLIVITIICVFMNQNDWQIVTSNKLVYIIAKLLKCKAKKV